MKQNWKRNLFFCLFFAVSLFATGALKTSVFAEETEQVQTQIMQAHEKQDIVALYEQEEGQGLTISNSQNLKIKQSTNANGLLIRGKKTIWNRQFLLLPNRLIFQMAL